jgi:hypothetical protein
MGECVFGIGKTGDLGDEIGCFNGCFAFEEILGVGGGEKIRMVFFNVFMKSKTGGERFIAGFGQTRKNPAAVARQMSLKMARQIGALSKPFVAFGAWKGAFARMNAQVFGQIRIGRKYLTAQMTSETVARVFCFV